MTKKKQFSFPISFTDFNGTLQVEMMVRLAGCHSIFPCCRFFFSVWLLGNFYCIIQLLLFSLALLRIFLRLLVFRQLFAWSGKVSISYACVVKTGSIWCDEGYEKLHREKIQFSTLFKQYSLLWTRCVCSEFAFCANGKRERKNALQPA